MGNIYIGDSNSKAKKIKNAYIGVNGVARKIKNIYIGDANGKARLIANMGIPMMISLCKSGNHDTIFMSNDGGNSFNMVTTNLASNSYMSNIVYNNDENKYVSLIRDGSTYTERNGYSYDGYTWTVVNGSPGTGSYLYYADGVYITGVFRSGVYSSTNMSSWTKAGIYDGTYCQEATYDPQSGYLAETYYDNYNQKYICAISQLGSSNPVLRYDGESYYTNIVIAGDYFIFGLNKTIYLISRTNPSPKGFYTNNFELKRLCYHDGVLLGCNYNYVYKSTDYGKTFTQIYQFTNYLECKDLCFYNGYYWLAGSRSSYNSSSSSFNYSFYLYKSSDGSNWELAYTNSGYTTENNCLCIPTDNGGRY